MRTHLRLCQQCTFRQFFFVHGTVLAAAKNLRRGEEKRDGINRSGQQEQNMGPDWSELSVFSWLLFHDGRNIPRGSGVVMATHYLS